MFDPITEIETMDLEWLLDNGWEISSNLAYRHILHEMNETGEVPCIERLEQILMGYPVNDYEGQKQMIIDALVEVIELKNFLPH